MKTKSFIISIMAIFIPFLFAINILRTTMTGNKNNFMGSGQALQYASEIDFSFTNTYIQVAKVGEEWNSADSFLSGMTALWDSIKIPFIAISDFLKGAYKCVEIFAKFIGLPIGEITGNSGGYDGSEGGGGGGGGTRPT